MANAATPGMANGYDPEKVDAYFSRISNLDDEIETIMGRAKADCKPYHQDIRDIYDEAKAEGFSPSVLKALYSIRRKEAKTVSKLDDDDRAIFEKMRDDFHGLGFGEYAEHKLNSISK